MADWKDNKGSGPWDFTPSPNKWGYLNNPLWSGRQDAIDFSEDHGLPLDLPNEHKPCGHWHKVEVSEEVFPAGRWVAAMQQPGTSYIYVYDILYKAVIRIDTSEIPVFVESILKLDSAYALDYDMGHGNPGAQRGAYCMNKDATRIWYLFCDQGQYPITRDHPDAQLIEVDISKTVMKVVKRTLFPNLFPSEPFPDPNWGRVNDGCSDDTHTYWCTDLIAGRIIKIRNSDHSIIDDHIFNYTIEACGAGLLDEAISTIDVNKSTGKLYWIYCRDHLGCIPPYNACRHLIRADSDFVADIDSIACATGIFTPAWHNMIRIYSNHILHHRSYHPTTAGYLMKRDLDCTSSGDEVTGTDSLIYTCIKDHISAAVSKPITGGNWSLYWTQEGISGGTWENGKSYSGYYNVQEYLQNILGVRDNKVFTLMYVNSAEHPASLYCLDFSDIAEISKLNVNYYAGQGYLGALSPYDWDWTSTSAMNYQTGVIAIFRYHNLEERNYVGCFDASPSLKFLCDVPLHFIKHTTNREMLNEPQSWPFEGFTPPEIPEEDPPIGIILPPGEDPGPGEEPYEPPEPPPDDAPDNVPILENGFCDYYIYVGPKQAVYYKIIAGVPECVQPIQIHNTPDTPRSIHLLIKRGSKPMVAEFERTWIMAPSRYDCGSGQWAPAKPGAEDLYWNYNTGSAAELVQIGEPMEAQPFYIMLYNSGTREIKTRLCVIWWTG